MRADKGRKASYPVLRAKITLDDGRVVKSRALNEVAIKRIEKTMVADVVIDKVKLERFRGDGISVSTPTGSTAYNKSLGGAILHPTMEAMQLTEISSLNNRVYRTLGSSVIVPKKIKLKSFLNAKAFIQCQSITKPCIIKMCLKLNIVLTIKISFVATPFHTSFWERVRDAFIGEVDS